MKAFAADALGGASQVISVGTIMDVVTSDDGTEIAFSRQGNGPPLLLVHGTTASARRWDALLPRFADRFTVAAMDRRGRGGSGDGTGYHLRREAEDIAAVAGALGPSVAVLAHSYGALCSLEAATMSSAISRLVLYEPPVPGGGPMIAPGVPERMQAMIDAGDLESALVLFMREGPKMPAHELEKYRKLPMWQTRIELVPTVPRELLFDEDYELDEDRLARVNIPVLLLLGGDSPPMFREGAERLDAILPDSRIDVMPGQQHIAMDLAPDLFMEKVLQFLD